MTHIEHMAGISAGAARDIANNSLTGHFIRSAALGLPFRVEQAREQSARIGKLPGACGRDRDPIAAGLEPVRLWPVGRLGDHARGEWDRVQRHRAIAGSTAAYAASEGHAKAHD